MEIDFVGEGFKYFGMLVAAGGGGAAIVFGVFQSWGNGWLNSHFDKRLEELKHEQVKDIEHLRYKINTLFDRAARVHALEFEALPMIWEALYDCYLECNKFVSPLKNYTDLSRFKNNDDLKEFLDEENLSPAVIKTISTSSNKQKEYISAVNTKSFNITTQMYNKFREIYNKKSVFIDQDIKSPINELSDLIMNALYEQHDNMFEKDLPRQRANIKKFKDNGTELFNKIEAAVSERLWHSTAAPI